MGSYGPHASDARAPSAWVAEGLVAALPLLVASFLPNATGTLPLSAYVPLHSFMEMFSIVVSALVFASSYGAPRARNAGVAFVGAGFLAVALLDGAHVLSFRTMPTFVTPSGAGKAIYFWLAARFAAGGSLLTVPLAHRVSGRRSTWLLVSLSFTALVYAVVLGAQDHLPAVIVEGIGLTRAKIGAEIAIAALHALAFGLLVGKGAPGWKGATDDVARAALLLTLGEVPFALYTNIADVMNLTGHAYKVAGYFLLYRGIFVESVRRPYADLAASNAALAESERRFEQLAQNIREVFWLRELDSGRYLYMSPGARVVFGRPPESFATLRDLVAIVHPDDLERFEEALTGDRARDSGPLEYRIVHPGGGVRWIRGERFPIRDADGRVRRVAGLTADVTDQRDASEMLARAQRMEGLGRFAGGVAHDFNNLLTIMLASLELAENELPADHPARGDLRQTFEAAQRARQLTSQLLAFAKRKPGESRVVDLGAQVAAATAMMRPMLGADVELAVLVDPGEYPVRIDPGQLDQVLLNLVTNAKDAMPSGGKIVVSLGRESNPTGGPPGRWVRLRVQDTGTGMSEEVAKHAFEPFYTTKGPGKGTGLGLATSFGIIEQAGGTIELHSELGKGTRIDLLLPPAAGPVTPSKPVPAKNPSSRGTETILVVEDEGKVRDFTARVLRRAGYEVLVAQNGVEALELADDKLARIDLVLSDVVMPLMSGPELVQRLTAARPQLKVLFVTGYAGEPQSSFSHPVFAKPYTGSALLERVRQELDAEPEKRAES
jgi:PAS domain S-box-containing protein